MLFFEHYTHYTYVFFSFSPIHCFYLQVYHTISEWKSFGHKQIMYVYIKPNFVIQMEENEWNAEDMEVDGGCCLMARHYK